MARNKYPEQTIEKILSISTKLFLENGYDKTTIQDILDELQMSKGAVYHHFKSKEEILEEIISKRTAYAETLMKHLILTTTAVNACEKIRKIILLFISDMDGRSIDSILSGQIKNPQFVVAGLKSSVQGDAEIISKLFLEGIEDGSIHTEYPLECAELFMLLLNIWINPVLFSRDSNQTRRRLEFLKDSMKRLGVDIITEEIIQTTIDTYKNMNAFKK